MATPSLQSESVVAIVIGNFNPRIVEPLWLSNNGLVAQEEAEGAERELVDTEMSRVVLPWAELVVLKDRIQTEGSIGAANVAQIRDLLAGVLLVLPHSPVRVVSLNHRVVVSAESEEQWHGVGHALAPKEIWEGLLDKPGMLDFAMQGVRPDGLDGAIKVRIQPVFDVQWGVFINVNDEFPLPDPDAPEPGRRAAELIQKVWPDAEARTAMIRSALYERIFR